MHSTIRSELYAAVNGALNAIPSDLRKDIYALSFFIQDEEDDPRRPTLTVGFNTIEKWRGSVEKASSSDEAKWNFAFWLQNEIWATTGGKWAKRIAKWVDALGFSYTDEDEADDFEGCMELGESITKSFVGLACEVATTLHETGAIVAVFGRQVPIIVHELEYYDEIADQTANANPPGLVEEFVAWVRES